MRKREVKQPPTSTGTNNDIASNHTPTPASNPDHETSPSLVKSLVEHVEQIKDSLKGVSAIQRLAGSDKKAGRTNGPSEKEIEPSGRKLPRDSEREIILDSATLKPDAFRVSGFFF